MNWKFWQKATTEKKQEKPAKSASREWLDAILFAVIAATLIRIFFLLKPIPYQPDLWKKV